MTLIPLLAFIAFAHDLVQEVPGCTEPGGARNVLFYVIDTCRADHLSVYGYPRPTTPFLEALAARGTVFESCTSQGAWTKPAMAALLTSRMPSQLGIYGMFQRLGDEHVLLPEALAAAGWATAGFSANPLMGELSNYVQGFQHFTESRAVNGADPIRFASGSAAKLNRHVFTWLDANDPAATFLYVHSVDPHEEYQPEREFLERFADPERDPGYRREWAALLATRPDVPGNRLVDWNFERAGVEPGPFVAHGRDLYDADIAANDAQIERLWERLQARGWGDDFVLIVTSDHGEEFYEHGGTSHGYSLYEELVRVPLIVVAPGLVPAGLRVSAPVRSIDVYPTLLDLLGVAAPPGLVGRSLVPLMRGEEGAAPTPVVSELTEDPLGRMAGSGSGIALSLRSGSWKLVANYRAPEHQEKPAHELYDLAVDPGERRDVAAEHPELVVRMDGELAEWVAGMLGLGSGPAAAEVALEEVDPATDRKSVV